MQAYPSVSTSSSNHNTDNASHNAPLTIDPAALFGGSDPTTTNPATTIPSDAALTTGTSSAHAIHSATNTSMAVKQEPDDGSSSVFTGPEQDDSPAPQKQQQQQQKQQSENAATPTDHAGANKHKSTSAAPSSHAPTKSLASEDTKESLSIVDEFLRRDHKTILRPDLSAFTDARDALRRLLPYHVWNIPHSDLLKALDLKEDPVLSEVRLRKRRRIASLNRRSDGRSLSTDAVKQELENRTEAGPSSVKLDSENGMQVDEAQAEPETSINNTTLDHGYNSKRIAEDDIELNELGLPVPLPEVPQPDFPTLDFAESVFARRQALASRFRRTLTALDTMHKRAPNTSLSLEHLERLAYNDDREEVLAQIEELKSLKAKLESLEETKQIDVAESSAKISLSFGITDEIEREREKEREQERIKRQQERAAAKAAKLEKEREARHRLGIFTPPPEPPSPPTPAPAPAPIKKSAPSPASSHAATPTPMAPSAPVPTSATPTSAALPMPSPYSAVSTPASTPGGYPFPSGANLPFGAPMPMSQAGPNGFMMLSPYSSMPGTLQGGMPQYGAPPGVPSFGPNGLPMLPGAGPIGTPTSAPFMPANTSLPGTPSTSTATPSKPLSKAKAVKAAAAAAAAAASAPGTPAASGTPGTPGATPGPTPHRGRGRPRKHPLPGTPGGPPLGSSVPRKKKEKPTKPPTATPDTPGPSGASTAMSPPSMPTTGMQVRPPSASPVPPTMPGPTPGYSGEMFASTLPPTPTSIRPPGGVSPLGGAAAPVAVRPPTMHPTLTSATSLNTPRASPPVRPSPSPAPSSGSNTAAAAAASKKAASNANSTAPAPASAPAPAASNANPSIPNHPIPLLIPVASLPRLSALGIQPTPSPHIRPVIGPNGQPQGLQGLPIPIDPTQSVPAVLLGISESTQAEASTNAAAPGGGGKQQILHISVVLSKLSPSQLSGLAVLMQSLQAQVEAGKRK